MANLVPILQGTQKTIADNLTVGQEYTFDELTALAIRNPAIPSLYIPGDLISDTSIQDAVQGLCEYGILVADALTTASSADPTVLADWGFTCAKLAPTTVNGTALSCTIPWTFGNTTAVGVFPV